MVRIQSGSEECPAPGGARCTEIRPSPPGQRHSYRYGSHSTAVLAYPLTAQSPLQLISHFVPCALSSSKIIKTYHIYIIFTYCIRTASRPSHVHGMKPSGMLQPFLHNAQAGIPAPSGPERLCISFCSAFPTAQRRLALTCADKLYSS